MKLLKLKSFRQSPGLCGPASLKMVLEYYGIEKSEKELTRMCRATANSGVEAKPIVEVAKKLGLKAIIKDNSNLNDLKKLLAKKIPVIVDWFSTDDGHYSVVVGLDKKYIYLEDPELGRLNKIKREIFYRTWFDFTGNFIKKSSDVILRRILVIHK